MRKFYTTEYDDINTARAYPYLNEQSMDQYVRDTSEALLFLQPQLNGSLSHLEGILDLIPNHYANNLPTPLGDVP